MTLTGDMLIGSSSLPASDGTMKALNPATGQQIEPDFALGGPAEVDRAARLADEAFDSYNRTGLKERAAFLELIADHLEGINRELAERAALETGLPPAQLQAEATKTAVQFRQFAEVVSQGRFRHATLDPAQPQRLPQPRMDHRMQKIAIGPVAIFGASNFPISYSVAGGDAARLLPILERRTGRIVVNAFAQPQEVGHATIHGGPFPATTDSRFTSVGMDAIDRFLRPVTYQGFPDALLPDALAADNPLGLSRLVDGHLTRD
jgi:acyl-CoA reductase-like NAD-dependent aldehyde dehydrogenase